MSWKKDLLGNQPNKESSSEQGDATLPTTMDVVSTTSMEVSSSILILVGINFYFSIGNYGIGR
jgi:hypothetical protein